MMQEPRTDMAGVVEGFHSGPLHQRALTRMVWWYVFRFGSWSLGVAVPLAQHLCVRVSDP